MTAAVTTVSIALAHARQRRPVVPSCPPDEHGACTCGGKWDSTSKQLVPHAPKEIGKAPIGKLAPHGITDATTNTATIDRWWRARPDANVNVELKASGWVVVDTDTPQVEADARSRGLDGAIIRESRNRAYVFARPDDCPIVNLIKADGDPLDILTQGNFVVHGTHQTGCPVRLDPDATPGPAPAWVVDLLKRKAAEKASQEATTATRRAERAAQHGDGTEPPVRLHQRGLRRWRGELVEMKDGHLDRDLSMFYIGLDLGDCGASESAIVAALEERDAALGWNKFTGRGDATKRYGEIAEKAVASALEGERALRIQFPTPSPEAATIADDVAALRAALDERDAEIARLRRTLIDRDDRLEVLEEYVHAIDDVLSRPDDELSADDKVVAIAGTRWLHTYRSKKLANGEPPTISLGYLAKVTGTPPRRVSKSLDRLSSVDPDDGAPFRKNVTRKQLDDGTTWESTLEVIPWAERPVETFRAAATYMTPARPKHGGSRAASDARWGRCEKHQGADIVVKGYCGACGKVVAEQRLSAEAFEALNVQVEHSEGEPTPSAEKVLVGVQVGHSAPTNGHGPPANGNGHGYGNGSARAPAPDPLAADWVELDFGP